MNKRRRNQSVLGCYLPNNQSSPCLNQLQMMRMFKNEYLNISGLKPANTHEY